MEHKQLEIQDYFIDGNCNTKLAKLIFKARSQTLDVKAQKKWKYADQTCIGCQNIEETGEEIMICKSLNNENRKSDIIVKYDWFYSNDINDIVRAIKILQDGLKRRQDILEAGIT